MHQPITTQNQKQYSTFEAASEKRLSAVVNFSLTHSPRYNKRYSFRDLPFDVWCEIGKFFDPDGHRINSDRDYYLRYLLSWRVLVIAIKLKQIPNKDKSVRDPILRCILDPKLEAYFLNKPFLINIDALREEVGEGSITNSLSLDNSRGSFFWDANKLLLKASKTSKKAKIPYSYLTESSLEALKFIAFLAVLSTIGLAVGLIEVLKCRNNSSGIFTLLLMSAFIETVLIFGALFFSYNFYRARAEETRDSLETQLSDQKRYTKKLLRN